MPDISMCKGDGCSVKALCHRHTATPSQWQSYFATSPGSDEECEYYWPTKWAKETKSDGKKDNHPKKDRGD